MMCSVMCVTPFLSIQAQDFIEEIRSMSMRARLRTFLSIQAQDFIEETRLTVGMIGFAYS